MAPILAAIYAKFNTLKRKLTPRGRVQNEDEDREPERADTHPVSPSRPPPPLVFSQQTFVNIEGPLTSARHGNSPSSDEQPSTGLSSPSHASSSSPSPTHSFASSSESWIPGFRADRFQALGDPNSNSSPQDQRRLTVTAPFAGFNSDGLVASRAPQQDIQTHSHTLPRSNTMPATFEANVNLPSQGAENYPALGLSPPIISASQQQPRTRSTRLRNLFKRAPVPPPTPTPSSSPPPYESPPLPQPPNTPIPASPTSSTISSSSPPSPPPRHPLRRFLSSRPSPLVELLRQEAELQREIDNMSVERHEVWTPSSGFPRPPTPRPTPSPSLSSLGSREGSIWEDLMSEAEVNRDVLNQQPQSILRLRDLVSQTEPGTEEELPVYTAQPRRAISNAVSARRDVGARRDVSAGSTGIGGAGYQSSYTSALGFVSSRAQLDEVLSRPRLAQRDVQVNGGMPRSATQPTLFHPGTVLSSFETEASLHANRLVNTVPLPPSHSFLPARATSLRHMHTRSRSHNLDQADHDLRAPPPSPTTTPAETLTNSIFPLLDNYLSIFHIALIATPPFPISPDPSHHPQYIQNLQQFRAFRARFRTLDVEFGAAIRAGDVARREWCSRALRADGLLRVLRDDVESAMERMDVGERVVRWGGEWEAGFGDAVVDPADVSQLRGDAEGASGGVYLVRRRRFLRLGRSFGASRGSDGSPRVLGMNAWMRGGGNGSGGSSASGTVTTSVSIRIETEVTTTDTPSREPPAYSLHARDGEEEQLPAYSTGPNMGHAGFGHRSGSPE